MLDEQATDSLINQLADEFVQRYRRGERPAIADYLAEYPHLGDEIRDLFPALIMLEGLVDNGHPSYSLLSGITRPDVLGDYRILQEVGRGGMGIVYEAEQISLGRHVALKILPFQFSGDDSAIERFQREAKAAAQLQHPNIVPVYDVGQEDSVWFYAMQFVHGQSLYDVMEELSRDFSGQRETEHQTTQLADLARSLVGGGNGGASFDLNEALPPQFCDDGGHDDAREQMVHTIVDEFLQQTRSGEEITEQTILDEYPDLASELAREFRMLRLLEASRPPQMVDDLTALEARLKHCLTGQSSPRSDDTQAKTASSARLSTDTLTGGANTRPVGQYREYYNNVARLVIQVANALAYAHQNGVIHRDVKPSNLLLDTLGHVWVTDFGLAKINRTDVTSTGKFVGTLRYMPPEQIQGHCDPRTDVYSLGITMYEMLTLRPAFNGANYLDTIHQICHEGPVPPRNILRSIPRDLETIVLKATQRDPDERYPHARAFAEDLGRFLEGQPVLAKRSGMLERAWKLCTRHTRTTSIVAVLTVFAVAGWLAFFVCWAKLHKLTIEQGDFRRNDGRNETLVIGLPDVPATERLQRGDTSKPGQVRYD